VHQWRRDGVALDGVADLDGVNAEFVAMLRFQGCQCADDMPGVTLPEVADQDDGILADFAAQQFAAGLQTFCHRRGATGAGEFAQPSGEIILLVWREPIEDFCNLAAGAAASRVRPNIASVVLQN